MVTNLQGLTLGQQVRGNQNDQLTGGYLNRTQRQISKIKYDEEYRKLKERAEQINSNIKTLEEYKQTYETLNPELKQFFRPPAEIENEINRQKSYDLSRIDAKIEEYNKKLAIEKNLQYTSKDQLAQTEHEMEANKYQTIIYALQNNKGKINEGYSYDSIVNYAESLGDYEIQKITSKGSILQYDNISSSNISEFQKNYPSEKLILNQKGDVIGVESGIFQKTYRLEEYKKAVEYNNKLYDDYVKATSKMQSISPTVKMLQEVKTGNIPLIRMDQKPLPSKIKTDFTFKDVGYIPYVAPLRTYTTDLNKVAFNNDNNYIYVKDQEKANRLNKQEQERYSKDLKNQQQKRTGSITFENYVNYKIEKIVNTKIPLDIYGNKASFKDVIRYTETRAGAGIIDPDKIENFLLKNPVIPLEGLTPTMVWRMSLFEPLIAETLGGVSKVEGYGGKVGGLEIKGKPEIAGVIKIKNEDVESKSIIKAGKNEEVSYGRFKVKVNEEGDLAYSRGYVSNIGDTKAGITISKQRSVISVNKEIGVGQISYKGIIKEDLGSVPAFKSGSLSKDIQTIKDIDLIGSNNWMRKTISKTKDQIKAQIPKSQETLYVIYKDVKKKNQYKVLGTTKFEEQSFLTTPRVENRILKDIKYYDELTGEVIKSTDIKSYLDLEKNYGKESRIKTGKVYDVKVLTDVLSKRKFKTSDVNIRYLVKILEDEPKPIYDVPEGIITFEKTGKDIADFTDMQLDKISKPSKKTPLSDTFKAKTPKEKVINKIMRDMFPEQKFPEKTITMEKIEKANIQAVEKQLLDQLEKENIKKIIRSVTTPPLEEYSIFGKKGVQPRGAIWGDFNEKTSLGKEIIKSNLPDNFGDSFSNLPKNFEKENNKIMGKINMNLKDAVKEKTKNQIKQQNKNDLKFESGQINVNLFDVSQKLDQLTGLKFKEALKTEQIFDQGFNQTPVEFSILKSSFIGMGGLDFWDLKQKIRKKKKKKIIKNINDLSLFPDFTSKALGLETKELRIKDVNKALRKVMTGFEIKRGVRLK